MDSKMIRRQRAPKTTLDQYEVFLDFAVKNYIIIDNKRDPLDTDQMAQVKWDELTAILNTSGRGPQRTTKEWQTTFSNWKNSIRHKMKCIIDGTSRTMLTELENRAMQLWDIMAYNGIPTRFLPNMTTSRHDNELADESTHSSSPFYVKEEQPQASSSMLQQQYSMNESSMNNADQSYGEEDNDDDNDLPLPPVPKISHAMPTPLPSQNHYKRRKLNSHFSSTPNHLLNRNGGGAGNGGDLDGSILIAESISKLADNVGTMAESIRDIAAAFTTTTQAAFELIRKQSEIIQSLIQQK